MIMIYTYCGPLFIKKDLHWSCFVDTSHFYVKPHFFRRWVMQVWLIEAMQIESGSPVTVWLNLNGQDSRCDSEHILRVPLLASAETAALTAVLCTTDFEFWVNREWMLWYAKHIQSTARKSQRERSDESGKVIGQPFTYAAQNIKRWLG